MAKTPVKSKWIGARVDDTMDKTIADYATKADITTGQLVRRAIVEYMQNHPNKEPHPDQTKLTPPGKE